jgi:hypothetical protein
METKHTPAPWTVTELGDIEAKETHVCQINQSMFNNQYPELKTHIEAQANAQLIAAAPELLEALIRAYNDFKTGRWTEETYNVIENTIKKATGIQSVTDNKD